MKNHKIEPIRDKKTLQEFIDYLKLGRNGQRDALLFKLGVTTGLRVSDLIKIKVSDVKDKTSFIITEQKTHKQRLVDLKEVLPELLGYLPTNKSTWLFPSSTNPANHIGTHRVYTFVTTAADNLGLKNIATHSMRKTFGYFFYQQTKDIGTLMKIMNHSNQAITLRYIGVEEEQVKASMANFRVFN